MDLQKNIIKKLPHELVNKIKAGEVVERPFNAVKELVENALDALATKIHVEILDGGKQLIRVSDNGFGIPKEQISLALERHATSKIQAFKDLETIASFGFRGEALPSLAAVSLFTVRSRTARYSVGYEITKKEGQCSAVEEVSMEPGTVVQAKELFFNVPARLKFLKSTATECAYIHDYLEALAFCYPKVAFELTHNGRTALRTLPKSNRGDRFFELLGETAKSFIALDFAKGSFALQGFVQHPSQARSTPSHHIIFVNGRYVKDKSIRAGALEAYQSLLLKGLTPAWILFLSVDPSWLDVNAHPAKTEVRFHDSPLIQDLVATALSTEIKAHIHKSTQESLGDIADSQKELPTEPFAPTLQRSDAPQIPLKVKKFVNGSPAPSAVGRLENPYKDQIRFSSSQNPTTDPEALTPIPLSENQNSQQISIGKSPFGQGVYLGQFACCYLLFEQGDALVAVDQHAFHERILFEEMITRQKNQPMVKQTLLNPLFVPAAQKIRALLEMEHENIERLGFEFETLEGAQQIVLHTYPAFLPLDKVHACFKEILSRVGDLHEPHFHSGQGSLQLDAVFRLFFATLACHSAVRAGDPLSPELVHGLMQRAKDVDFYAHCPHGRPVLRVFSKKEVSGWFLRN